MQFLETPHGPIRCERIISGIAVNPANAPAVCDPIRRSDADLHLWRRRPFIAKNGDQWVVSCLLFPTDRPTVWGTYDNLDDSIDAANRPVTRSPASSDIGNLDF